MGTVRLLLTALACLVACFSAHAQTNIVLNVQPTVYTRTIPPRLYVVPTSATNYTYQTVTLTVTNTVTVEVPVSVTNTVTETVIVTNQVPGPTSTVALTLRGDPTREPWTVEAVPNAHGNIVVRFYGDGVLRADEKFAPFCFWGDDGSSCFTNSLGTGVHTVAVEVRDAASDALLATSSIVFKEGSDTAPPVVSPLVLTLDLPAGYSATLQNGNTVRITPP